MKANKQLQFSLAIALALVNPLFAEDSNQELLKGSVEPPTGESGLHSDQSDNPNSHTLGTVKVEADAIPENEIEDYYNPNYDGTNSFYKRSNSNTATKTDTPIMENPVSIQVVPRAVMDDQKSTRIKDVLENVSGVRSQASLGFGTGFIIRGFRTNRTYRNGLVADANSFHTDFEAANLESVDVLKGPAAVMFGRIEPGGLVNLNTKKPMFAPYYSVEQQFGNYDFYRTQWDATGDILGDGKLAYRFTGAYQNSNSFRDLVFNDRYSIAPSITWRPTEATDISLNIEGVEQDFQADYGIPAINGRPARIPTGNNFGDPNEPNDQISKLHIGTEINHRFNDDWAIHNRFLMSHLKSDTLFVNPATAFDPGALKNNRFLERDIFFQEDDVKGYSTNLDITGKFNIGSTKHNVLAGFDFTQFYSGYHTRGNWDIPNTAIPGRDSDNNPNTDLTIDIFNPRASYGINPSLFRRAFGTYFVDPKRPYNMFKDQWYGVYFQDQITFWDKLHILGGGRYDWAESGRGRGSSYANAANSLENPTPEQVAGGQGIRDAQGFSPRVGVLYEPWKFLSVYGSWTTSFNANNGNSEDGKTFDPERGEQFEAGIKTSLFDNRLLATVAYYHLVKDNILVRDPTPPTNDPFARVSNKQRSQGIELDVTGQVTDQLSLIGSYAFTDARVTRDFVNGTEGNRLPNVPEHSGSLWLKYDMKGFDAKDGFSFGVGGVAAGTRQGDFANSFQLPGYVRMDVFGAYKLKFRGAKITTQINIRNILDKNYYESTDPDSNVAPALGIAPGAPLTAIGSIRVEY